MKKLVALAYSRRSEVYWVAIAALDEHVTEDGFLIPGCVGYAISKRYKNLDDAIIARDFIADALAQINDPVF